MRRVFFDGPRGESVECETLEFADLTLGATYVSGDTFTTEGVEIIINDFFTTVGQCAPPTTSGSATVFDSLYACRSDKELWLDNVNLAFDFGAPLSDVVFRYGEYGGVVNLNVNSDCLVASDFIDLHGSNLGGVWVSVNDFANPGTECGEIALQGVIESVCIGGQELAIDDVHYCLHSTVGIEDPTVVSFISPELYSAPNPFSRSTNIWFAVPVGAQVRLTIHDVCGRLMRELTYRGELTGPLSVRWDGRDAAGRLVPPSVYFCRVTAGAFKASCRMVVLR
jgi:hypothetical protein